MLQNQKKYTSIRRTEVYILQNLLGGGAMPSNHLSMCAAILLVFLYIKMAIDTHFF